MLLKYFYDSSLAHASYLVGCQQTGEALVVDPGRNVSPYLKMAEEEGVRIVGAAETHIHADFVSGARELAERVGATLYLSDEGEVPWRYDFAAQYEARLLQDGDTFRVGNVHFDVMHTPGHTPESLSFLLTDRGGEADEPMGIFTGDFVFVGAVGRPDLLEKAVGEAGNARKGAHQMFHALQRFKALPEYLQVWPAHGAGSACGKGLGAVPSTTVGYELRFNPALAYEDEEAFVAYLLDEQPEVPPYFKEMKRVNRDGPTLLHQLPQPARLPATGLTAMVEAGAQVVDVRPSDTFADGHMPATINIPLGNLGSWAGWLVSYDVPLYLIAEQVDLDEAERVLHKIGVDRLAGYVPATELIAAGLATERYLSASPQELAEAILADEVIVVDVRAEEEWQEGHLPNARHIMLGTLPERVGELIDSKPIVLHCLTGVRSAIATSIVQAAGAARVINMAGGYSAWEKAGLPVEG